jgi:DNA-binding FadR family transcriptional regulator
MGLLEARPQVGTRVLPPNRWDLLNPHVVKWRAQGPDYLVQMHQLLELRLGIEQAAAGLAATRMSRAAARRVLEAGLEMRQALETGDARTFFDADVTFHRLLLEGTDNAVIAQLADTIGVVLRVRGTDPRPGMHDMSLESVERHLTLARAVVDGDPAEAQAAATGLVEGTLHEVESLLPGEFRPRREAGTAGDDPGNQDGITRTDLMFRPDSIAENAASQSSSS